MGSGLTNEQKSVIIGTLLGDGCMELRKKNPRLRIDHAMAQKEYVFWKYDIFKNIATREPHILYETDKRSNVVGVRWYFSTRALTELHLYYALFYQDKKKIIREALLHYFIHPRSLAVWLMDDGYKRNDCDAIRLSTDCFSYEEQKILQWCLEKNFGICSTLHRKGTTWNIYIPHRAMERMRILIAQYILPSMQYKLPPRNDLIHQPMNRIAVL